MEETRKSPVSPSGAWAAAFSRGDAPAVAAALRLHAGVRGCFVDDALWLRGDVFDERLAAAIAQLAPAARYEVHGIDEELIPAGNLLPIDELPKARWVPLPELFLVDRPAAALPAAPPPPVRVTLVRTDQERPAKLLRTNLAIWAAYAEGAPQIRLRPLRFAATYDEVLVWGGPLPPLPGTRLHEREGVAVPCGWAWSPPVDALTLRRALGLAAGEVAAIREDGGWDLIPADGFVAARRSAVRETVRAGAAS